MVEERFWQAIRFGDAYPELKDYLLIAVTEKRSKKEMDDLLSGLEGLS